jgi:hypothetical protein
MIASTFIQGPDPGSFCSVCPPGTYSDSGAAGCERCAAGKYSTSNTATSSGCYDCPSSSEVVVTTANIVEKVACAQDGDEVLWESAGVKLDQNWANGDGDPLESGWRIDKAITLTCSNTDGSRCVVDASRSAEESWAPCPPPSAPTGCGSPDEPKARPQEILRRVLYIVREAEVGSSGRVHLTGLEIMGGNLDVDGKGAGIYIENRAVTLTDCYIHTNGCSGCSGNDSIDSQDCADSCIGGGVYVDNGVTVTSPIVFEGTKFGDDAYVRASLAIRSPPCSKLTLSF